MVGFALVRVSSLSKIVLKDIKQKYTLFLVASAVVQFFGVKGTCMNSSVETFTTLLRIQGSKIEVYAAMP